MVRMKHPLTQKHLPLCLVLLLFPARLMAADPASTALPHPLVFHARIASPEQCVKDLDALVALSLAETPGARRVPPGMVSMLLTMACPLPQAAWKAEEDAHILALINDAGKTEYGFVVNGYGLDRVAEALGETAPPDGDAGVLVATLKNGRQPACFQAIGNGRLLITNSRETGAQFKHVLEDWDPGLESDAPIAGRVDLANFQSLIKTNIASIFERLRDTLDNESRKLAALREKAEDDDVRADIAPFENVGKGAIATLARFIDAAEQELPSLREAGFELDFRGDRLLATASLAAAGDSVTGEFIADVAGTDNPDFPFIEAFSDRAVYYSYQAPASGKTAARTRRFFREAIDGMFAEASPGTAAELTGLLDGIVAAGPGAIGTGAELTEYGDMVPVTYTGWERPEEIIPLIRRAAALLDRLHGEGAALAEKYFRNAMQQPDASGATERASEKKREFADMLANGGIREMLKPVFHSDDGDRYGVPYASLAVDLNFESVFEPMQADIPEAGELILSKLRAIEERLKFFWARAGGAVAFTNGELDLDDMDASVAAMLLGVNGENEANLRFAVEDERLAAAALHRQSGFSLYRPSRSAAMLLLQCASRLAPGNYDVLEQAWEIFNEVEDGDAFFSTWSGAADGRLRLGLVMPAGGINEMVRNGYALQDKLVVLVARLAAIVRSRR